MTLQELGYEPYMDNEKFLSYRKIIGDTDIVLEIDKKTQKVTKTANDFRKIVEIEPETIEEILMENEVRKP